MTRRGALEGASEINVLELQPLVNVLEDDCVEGSGFPNDNSGDYVPQSQLLSEWKNETNHAAAHDNHPKSKETGHFDNVHRSCSSSLSSLSDAGEIEDYAPEAVELARVIEDSQPDASEEIFHPVMEQELPTSVAQGAVGRADEEKVQELRRLPPTALEAEKQMAQVRPARSSNTLEERKNSVIEID